MTYTTNTDEKHLLNRRCLETTYPLSNELPEPSRAFQPTLRARCPLVRKPAAESAAPPTPAQCSRCACPPNRTRRKATAHQQRTGTNHCWHQQWQTTLPKSSFKIVVWMARYDPLLLSIRFLVDPHPCIGVMRMDTQKRSGHSIDTHICNGQEGEMQTQQLNPRTNGTQSTTIKQTKNKHI